MNRPLFREIEPSAKRNPTWSVAVPGIKGELRSRCQVLEMPARAARRFAAWFVRLFVTRWPWAYTTCLSMWLDRADREDDR